MPNPSGSSNPPKKAVRFAKCPSTATLVQVRLRTQGAAPARTQPKTGVQPQTKLITKTDPDVSAAVREVQLEDEEPYTEDELEDLANFPTNSEPDDLGDVDSENFDDINPE